MSFSLMRWTECRGQRVAAAVAALSRAVKGSNHAKACITPARGKEALIEWRNFAATQRGP
jgi:hypothetical protein